MIPIEAANSLPSKTYDRNQGMNTDAVKID